MHIILSHAPQQIHSFKGNNLKDSSNSRAVLNHLFVENLSIFQFCAFILQ